MNINTNMMAINSNRVLGQTQSKAAKSMEKLSTGLRINKAGDDAAGLGISEKMRGQIRGLNQASRNAQDGISLLQTAEGALGETHDMLQRIRELTVQSSNGTNTTDEKTQIQEEVGQLTSEITNLASRTEYNGQKLLTGTLGVKEAGTGTAEAGLTAKGVSVDVAGAKSGATFTITKVDGTHISLSDGATTQSIAVADSADYSGTLNFDKLGVKLTSTASVDYGDAGITAKTIDTTGNSATLQIGANSGQTLSLQFNDMQASALGTSAGKRVSDVDVTSATQTDTDRLQIIDDAIKQVSAERSKMGATQNRLEHTINNLNTSSENITAAESRIRDVDMAKEMMDYSKNNILQQAALSMLAQANQAPQAVLKLLQ